MEAETILAVDVGGTFTDAVLRRGSHVVTAKTPTTPEDQSLGVLTAAAGVLEQAGVTAGEVTSFIHGMTVTTNALLEGSFARTALLTSEGFADLEEIGRQNRPDLYRPGVARPAPVVPPELRFELPERCTPEGVLRALEPAAAERAVADALAAGAEALAVCLLFSFRHPEHELIVREAAARIAPQLHVSLSHEVVGTFREYERLATTVLDAALSPRLAGYLARLTLRAAELGLPRPEVMLSNGGTVPAELAAANASWTLLSGPAGGAVGAARAALRNGAERALALDMGGTSTDISLSAGGHVAVSAGREIGGRPVALPAVDVATVGAGGGSIAWADAGGALRVGPRSAGARPGPACYGHGGKLPTVTDANLLLGRLGDASALAGGITLDRAAAERAVGGLADQLGLELIETAAGIIEIADLEMLRQAAAVTVARGIDPREHTLVAFGGAGPMHAAAIAESLEITRILCPAACGVLSAFGMSVTARRRDRSVSLVRALNEISELELAEIEHELARTAADDLDAGLDDLTVATSYELRYVGQAFELSVEGARAELVEHFHVAHQQRFGFTRSDEQIELVTLRVSVAAGGVAGDDEDPRATAAAAASTGTEHPTRAVFFNGEEHETPLLAHAPAAAQQGPLILELPEATVVVPPGWSARGVGQDVLLERVAR